MFFIVAATRFTGGGDYFDGKTGKNVYRYDKIMGVVSQICPFINTAKEREIAINCIDKFIEMMKIK